MYYCCCSSSRSFFGFSEIHRFTPYLNGYTCSLTTLEASELTRAMMPACVVFAFLVLFRVKSLSYFYNDKSFTSQVFSRTHFDPKPNFFSAKTRREYHVVAYYRFLLHGYATYPYFYSYVYVCICLHVSYQVFYLYTNMDEK